MPKTTHGKRVMLCGRVPAEEKDAILSRFSRVRIGPHTGNGAAILWAFQAMELIADCDTENARRDDLAEIIEMLKGDLL